jgi:crotonobetainyl-CoA:carnitine CoA-transferase CaiB-like acyl-CoA transferase
MRVSRKRGRAPVTFGGPIADLNAATLGAHRSVLTYIHRLPDGEQQRTHTSLPEGPISCTVWESMPWFVLGHVSGRTGAAHRLSAAHDACATADRHVTVSPANQAKLFVKLFGSEDRVEAAQAFHEKRPVAYRRR